MKMYNYKTGMYDNVESPDVSYADYIPQDEAAQRVYALSVELGETPSDAAINVLRLSLERFQDTSNNNGE